jgi:hypothetical protein
MLYTFLHTATPGKTKDEVLSAAPQHCTAIFIQYEHKVNKTSIQHYKTWMKGAPGHNGEHPEDWYECESIAYSQYRQVRQLTANDWLEFTGNMMCLVAADAYATNMSIFTALVSTELTAIGHRHNTGQVHAVDGRTVQLSPTPNTCMTERHRQCQALQAALRVHTADDMQNDQPPPPQQQPRVHRCNTTEQPETMELSSDEEPNDKIQVDEETPDDDDMQSDQPPPPPLQQPRVYWCNPIAQPETMEISSDEEPNDRMQVDEETPDDDEEIWVDPTTVGLYCEPQEFSRCLCHAWHALLGRRVIEHLE